MTRIKSLLVTGSNGFVGKSFLDFLSALPVEERPLSLGLVARNASPQLPEGFETHTKIVRIQADLTNPWDFEYPATHIVHFAADGSESAYSKEAADRFVLMAERLISFSAKLVAPTVFHASSGACFGRLLVNGVPDTEQATLTDKKVVFVQSRLDAEAKLKEAQALGQMDLRVGRLYSFIGKYLFEKPHYAVPSFVNMALEKKNIKIEGNPLTTRSYLSGDDMAKWIYRSLTPGVGSEILSIGSEKPVTMEELAAYIASVTGSRVTLLNPKMAGDYYVADNWDTRTRLVVQESGSWQTSIDDYLSFIREMRTNEHR